MKERPILFNGAMVRAILDGSKTQTRRVVKFRHTPPSDAEARRLHPAGFLHETGFDGVRCPFGSPGDRLWVRETWRLADGVGTGHDWRDCHFRPRGSSSLTNAGAPPSTCPAGPAASRWR